MYKMESINSNSPIANIINPPVKSIMANRIPMIPAEVFASSADFIAKNASTNDTISFIIYVD